MLLELNPFSIISIESKIASIEPFFIPPLSAAVKSIRISFCISTCRSQYLLPSAIVFQSGEYCIFSHFVCVLLHKLYFWMQIVWFVENNLEMLKCDLRQRERLLRGPLIFPPKYAHNFLIYSQCSPTHGKCSCRRGIIKLKKTLWNVLQQWKANFEFQGRQNSFAVRSPGVFARGCLVWCPL